MTTTIRLVFDVVTLLAVFVYLAQNIWPFNGCLVLSWVFMFFITLKSSDRDVQYILFFLWLGPLFTSTVEDTLLLGIYLKQTFISNSLCLSIFAHILECILFVF